MEVLNHFKLADMNSCYYKHYYKNITLATV